jgi:hypothetical protein
MKRKRSPRPDAAAPTPASITLSEPPGASWNPSTRIAFRFAFIYLGMFCLASQVSGSLILISGVDFRGFGLLWPMRPVTVWVAEHVFGATDPLAYGRNSGETLFFWVQTFWLLIVAIAAAALWSLFDKKRKNYDELHKWSRLFLRFALAASMFEYGMTKVIPVQFASPSLNTLVTPVGNLSLSNLLWTSIGSSPAYQIFTGCAEMLGGILLLFPRTTLFGAMICLADMTQVFVLNMTYDIGLKQISFHLIVLSVVLIAPDFRRLANLFLFDRSVSSSNQQQLFRSSRANRIALIVQVALGLYLISIQTYANWNYWNIAGGGRPKSPLYGIWSVEQLSVDGEVRPPSMNDYDRRWRRVIFDSVDSVAFQRTDDSVARYGVSIDVYKRIIAMRKGNSTTWRAHFTFDRPRPDHLNLDGEMDGHRIHADLQLVEFDTFRLLNSPFRWVRPSDDN